ncbi:MAG: hypothetical protein KAR24_01700 [Candidatus Pacebacteria bacterium]|nr:hypothetical protein [Candidatus Paceibacterota bacterium]
MEDTPIEFVDKKEGLVWAVFIVFIVLVGFVAVLGISSSSITNMAVDIPAKTAGTGNIVSQDVDITIVPVDVLE